LKDTDIRILSSKKRPDDKKPLVVKKHGSVQGRLYHLGGKDDAIQVSLEGANGETLLCEASIDITRELSCLLFKQVRVSGYGTWERSPEAGWRLNKLKIESYQELDEAKVGDVVSRLQAIGGLKWADMEDPHGVARDLGG